MSLRKMMGAASYASIFVITGTFVFIGSKVNARDMYTANTEQAEAIRETGGSERVAESNETGDPAEMAEANRETGGSERVSEATESGNAAEQAEANRETGGSERVSEATETGSDAEKAEAIRETRG